MQAYVVEANLTLTITNVFSEDHMWACFWKALEDMGIHYEVEFAEVRDAYEID